MDAKVSKQLTLVHMKSYVSVQAIFLTYGCMDQASAALIAELMGFQPALVMPQLHKHILQGRRGYPSAAQGA